MLLMTSLWLYICSITECLCPKIYWSLLSDKFGKRVSCLFSLVVSSPNRSCQERNLAVPRWFLQSVKSAKEIVVERDDNSDSSKKVYNAHAIFFPYGRAYTCIQISFHSVSIGLPGQERALCYNTALLYFCALFFFHLKPSKKVNTGTSHPETCSRGGNRIFPLV